MKKCIAFCVAVSLVCGSAYALDYTWIGANGASWTVASNWDNGSGSSITYPNSAADTALFTSTNWALGTGLTINIGEYRVGPAGYGLKSAGNTMFVVSSGGGKSGDYWKPNTNSAYSYWSPNLVTEVWGNYMNKESYIEGHYMYPVLKMMGNNKGWFANDRTYLNIQVYGQGVWDNATGYGGTNGGTITVKSGGSIGGAPTKVIDASFHNGNSVSNSVWALRRLILEDGQNNLPAFGSNASFCYSALDADNATKNLVVTGGVTYPQDVFISQSGIAAKNPYTWRIKGGNFTCLNFQMGLYSTTYYEGGLYIFDTIENGTTNTYRNLTTRNSLIVAHDNYDCGTRNGGRYLFRANNSTITVGGAIEVSHANASSSGAIDMGNATFYLGRDLKIYKPPVQWCVDNWNPGLSTVICNGNGTASGVNQTLNTWGDCGIKLHTLIINTGAGDCVTLAAAGFAGAGNGGRMVLTGDLLIQGGKFLQNNQQITFNGDCHTFTNLVNPLTYLFDNIALAPDAVLLLGSDISIGYGVGNYDNLVMGAGSKLYLNGFTLKAEGSTFSGVGTWSWDGGNGTIFGDQVPEPATLLLVGTGLLGAFGCARRRRMR